MAEKDNNMFAGFEAVAGSISPFNKKDDEVAALGTSNPEYVSGEFPTFLTDSEEDESEEDLVNPEELTGGGEEEEDDIKKDESEEIEESEEEDKPKKKNKEKQQKEKEQESDDEEDSLEDYEQDITNYVRDKLFDKLGWQAGEEDNFQSVDDIVDYLQKIVEENSTPEYANEELQQLDDYVRSGGDLRNFFDQAVGQVNIDNLDLTLEEDQKAVVAEHLANQGHSQDRIKRYLERYENSGILADEAEEAIDLVKNYRQKQQEKLLNEQKKVQQEYEQQQQKFISDVQTNINSLSDVRGIPVTGQEKKKLFDYMFKVGGDGYTQYQKDYNDNFTKNFIESAFLTMNGDSAFTKVERKAKTDAAKELKRKLQQKNKRTKVADNENSNRNSTDFSSFNSFKNLLRKP